LGFINRNQPELKVSVSEYHYRTSGIAHHPDVALFKLSKPVNFTSTIYPIRLLPRSQINERFDEWTAPALGWKNSVLQYFTHRIMGMYEYGEPNVEIMISTNYPNCREYTIEMRSGSGLLYMGSDGNPTLISIYGGATGGKMISTRIGMFYDWIIQTTGIKAT